MRLRFCLLVILFLFIPSGAALAIDFMGPGQISAPLMNQTLQSVGVAKVWNTQKDFYLELVPAESWVIRNVQVYVGNKDDRPIPATRKGNLIPGRFPYKEAFANGTDNYKLVLNLVEDLDFAWGVPYTALRDMTIAVHVSAAKLNEDGTYIDSSAAWAYTGVGVDTEVGLIEETDLDATEFEGMGKGWLFGYKLSHPKAGHFIDSPVQGLNVITPTFNGVTDASGYFDFFPGETATFSLGDYVLGSAVADHKVSPLDMFSLGDTEDHRVVNMAMLLQSLDQDGDPQGGITISPEAVSAFEQSMKDLELTAIDFANDQQVEAIITGSIAAAAEQDPPMNLTRVGYEDAKGHLDDTLSNVMFRKNVSKTPELASSKAKMNIATVWLPARRANDDLLTDLGEEIEYYDEDGELIRTTTQAKPIIVTYTDANLDTGEHDVFAAVSRDDGETWKRKNLSRMADRSSFTTANGEPYYGGCKKPVFQVKGNKILVAWSSKFAKGGKPRYAIEADDPATEDVNEGDDYIYDDPYAVDDIWGVAGPQRSHDYTEDGFTDAAETPYSALEVPHSALWVCRGIIATQKDVDAGVGDFVGDIVWFKPERMTSGRRDVNQIFVGAAGSAGFAMVWQEDPNGVKPGKALGPGPGWGGATTSHKTDIWYSYLAWGDHTKVDTNFVPGSDVEHDVDWESNRPKALVPMSLPVRLTDNEVINTDNILVELDGSGFPTTSNPDNPLGYTPVLNELAESEDADGTHAYGYMVPGLIDVNNVSGAPESINQNGFYEFVNYQEETKFVAITEDGRLLDGDTGASRGNIFLQPYAFTKPDGSVGISAWAIITYEETKGAGAGPPEDVGTGEQPEDGTGSGNDAYIPEEGKNVIYHSFDFKNPDLVSAGRIVNRPEFIDYDEDNYVDSDELVYLVDEVGVQILDYLERPQLAYENARRGRFLPQGLGAFGSTGTTQLMVHKQGPEGAGRPSDILLRRWVIPEGATKVPFKNGTVTVGFSIKASDGTFINPYSADCLVGDWVEDTLSGQSYYADGVQNVSSVTPTITTESQGEPEQDDPYGAVKVVEWVQTIENLDDPTGSKTYDENGNVIGVVGNPYDDARAHRGAIRGDYVAMGFSYTANWAAARNGNDNYNFYIRRSFDGGQTWITDPAGSGVEHCRTWTYPSGTQSAGTKVEECNFYSAGEFEAMRNLSQLPNHKSSVIEPRIVAVPGTIKASGLPTGELEDVQNKDVFYVAYGTSTNPKKDPVTGEQEEPAPQDLYWSVSTDRGESYYEDTWYVQGEPGDGSELENGDEVTGWPWMAKGDQEQGEVQLRMTPDGSRFYASWLDEGAEGSDIVFRRILPPVFDVNVSDSSTE